MVNVSIYLLQIRRKEQNRVHNERAKWQKIYLGTNEQTFKTVVFLICTGVREVTLSQ